MIYLVEDDENVRELVCYALRSSDFDVEGFDNSRAFWTRVADTVPDLVILDIMLPGEDGFATLAKLKKSQDTTNIPVIMLTARGTEYDRIRGLDSGADDYITKPFSVLELLARVRALLRRAGRGNTEPTQEASTQETDRIQVGELLLDPQKRIVKVSGKSIALTFKEFELLYHLLRHKDVVLTRDQLLTSIWGYEYDGTSNRTVDMHIKTLRQKLGACGDMVKTIRGVGYKITWEEEIL